MNKKASFIPKNIVSIIFWIVVLGVLVLGVYFLINFLTNMAS